MSVQVLDIKAFEALNEYMQYMKHNKTCDIKYCSELTTMTEEGVNYLVHGLCKLNEISYKARYRETDLTPTLWQFIDLNKRGLNIDTYQFLKYLIAINYNIEIETIEERRPLTHLETINFETLQKIIEQVKMSIIASLQEYDRAEWTTYSKPDPQTLMVVDARRDKTFSVMDISGGVNHGETSQIDLKSILSLECWNNMEGANGSLVRQWAQIATTGESWFDNQWRLTCK